MKKTLILFCALCVLTSNAQTFYEPSDMNVTFSQTNQSSYWQPDFVTPSWSYSFIDGKGVMCATWLIQGKFATIYFAQDKTDLGICGTYGITKMDELNNAVSIQLQYSSGNIEFDKIAYNPNRKALWIPYGTGSDVFGNAYYNILWITLSDVSNSFAAPMVEDVTMRDETYYNLNGQMIDPETSEDKIIIKSDGTSSEKILNKR